MIANTVAMSDRETVFPISTEAYGRRPVTFLRPKEIACFSYDKHRQYFPDARSLRYYYPPRRGVDLSQGFESFRRVDEAQDEHLDSLLASLMKLEKETGKRHETDIVTWRGMATKIMTCPYENDGFEMNAIKFQGTIFVEENHAFKKSAREEQFRRRPQPGAPTQDVMSFWGYKFETVSTIDAPWDATTRQTIESREQKEVENCSQYCSIVQTGIADIKLVLGGEVDAVWDQKPTSPDDPINWVELKTSAAVQNDRDMVKYERKLLKFFTQSFLLGVPRIIVGMRTKAGTLQDIEELETTKIPAIVKRNGRGLWDGTVCLNFTAAFLAWLQNVVDESGAWRIRRKFRSPQIEVFRLPTEDRTNILSEDFLKWRQDKLV